jgi:hypothetical protein
MLTVALVEPTATVSDVLPAAFAVQLTRLVRVVAVGAVVVQVTMPALVKVNSGRRTSAAGMLLYFTDQVTVLFTEDPAAGDTASVMLLGSPVRDGAQMLLGHPSFETVSVKRLVAKGTMGAPRVALSTLVLSTVALHGTLSV